MKFIIITIITVLLIALAVLLLGVKIFFVKDGKFPSGHVHDNPKLRERGIGCASHSKD